MPTLGAQLHYRLTATYGVRVQAIANRFGANATNVYDTLLDPAFDAVGSGKRERSRPTSATR